MKRSPVNPTWDVPSIATDPLSANTVESYNCRAIPFCADFPADHNDGEINARYRVLDAKNGP
jgi:hypothetical protein